jgi:pyrroloquinoline-quinone synthase
MQVPKNVDGMVESPDFFVRLNESIHRFDLLRHPFYQSWSRGELSAKDLQDYAKDYYHQVVSFPRCLSEFARRLPHSELRQAVLENLSDEVGDRHGPSHADLWLDFAEGVGAGRSLLDSTRSFRMRNLTSFFQRVAKNGTPEQALAAFYVYESQVPRVSQEKLRGLRELYGADDHTCQYFIVHIKADVRHSEVWRQQLEKCLDSNPEAGNAALRTAEAAACALWQALDTIDGARLDRHSS